MPAAFLAELDQPVFGRGCGVISCLASSFSAFIFLVEHLRSRSRWEDRPVDNWGLDVF